METQVTRYSRPFTESGTFTARSPGKSAGISFGARTGAPISTVTEETAPPFTCRKSVLMPLFVSTVSVCFFMPPRSNRYFPTQRMALPHIIPSLPSRLNMRIRASALSLLKMSTMPSPPTER